MGLLGDYGSDSEDSSDNEEHEQNINSKIYSCHSILKYAWRIYVLYSYQKLIS